MKTTRFNSFLRPKAVITCGVTSLFASQTHFLCLQCTSSRGIDKIRDGSAETRDGRRFYVRDTTPFYCYIICDLTKNLEVLAKSYNMQRTPDEYGYFGYNTNYQAYVEVISFDKLVGDAYKRNKILFDKLRLDSDIFLDSSEQPDDPERPLN